MDPSNYSEISVFNVIYKYFHLYLIIDLQNGLTTSTFWMNVKQVLDVTIWELICILSAKYDTIVSIKTKGKVLRSLC